MISCATVTMAGSAAALAAPHEPPDHGLSQCLDKLRGGAPAHGVSVAAYDRLARGIQWQTRTIDASRSQPETLQTWTQYLDRVLTPARVARGQKIFAEWRAAAERVAWRYGSDADVITAIWGVESDFGTSLGTFPVLDAWATLVCHKPSELRLKNFYGSMRLLAAGRVPPADRFTGSWSGAFGLTQFIPTSYEAYAADGDDDGRIDLYNSVPDAMASTARHLAERTHWTRGLPPAIEVTMPPQLLKALSRGSDDERWDRQARPLSFWLQQNVKGVDGSDLSTLGVPASAPLQALLTAGAQGRVYLVSSNFDALMSYNKSTKYAIAVSTLARRVREQVPAAPAAAASIPGAPAPPGAVPASATR